MSAAPLALAGLGAVTPVGLSAPATCAALRAGVARMLVLEGWDDDGGAPDEVFAAGRVPLEWMAPGYPYEWPGHERLKAKAPAPERLAAAGDGRLAELAVPAAEEAWANAGLAGRDVPRLGLYLGLDEEDDGRAIAQALAGTLGVRFELQRQDCLGRAAGLAALHRAARHLREDRVDVALVGGVDSLLRRSRIARLVERGMLKHDDQSFGVIPGEAAAFVVLAARAEGARLRVGCTAVADEQTARRGEPSRGEALTRVLREAADGLEAYPHVVCDLNGDRYRHLEWGLAGPRTLGRVRKRDGGPREVDLQHPADCIGDTGAASGVLNLAWAATALRAGYARSPHAVVWGGSDGGLRAAATLELRARGQREA